MTVQLAARSLPPAIHASLHQADGAQVLHVFEHVVNLVAGDKVLSLVTPKIGNGPFNIVLPDLNFKQHISPSNTLTVRPNALHIGNLVIDLAPAALWNPRPNWPRLRLEHARLRAQIPVIRAVLQQHAPANSWASLIVDLPTTPRSNLDTRIIKLAQQQWKNLYEALIKLDQAKCAESARHLVGLGNGLTPSGDDWLVGCGLAAQLNWPSPEAASLLLETIALTAPGTTRLSATWLQAAADGMCSEHWHRLFEAALDDVFQAALRIIEQGHSSGADALAGYLAMIPN